MSVKASPVPGTDAREPRPSEPDDRRRAETLADGLVAATTAALEIFSIHLGRELGLYEALLGPAQTYPELAARAGIAPRYAREWLEQQAVAGLIDVVGGDSGAPEHRRYTVPRGHRPVLLEPDDPLHVAPMVDMVAGIAGVIGELPGAYVRGEGIPYASYGRPFRQGQGGVNRPAFTHDLATWVEAMPDVAARLCDNPLARVADIGCGEGWSTIALARTFPQAAVDGYDADPASVEAARHHASQAGLGDRVAFHVADAGDAASLTGPYDLILVLEALHDLSRPVQVLDVLREACAEEGTLLVVDERVAEAFSAPGDAVERLMYGWSILHCLPASLADSPSAALGTVLRSSTVHGLAARAGFADSVELPLDNDFFRFYRFDI